MATACDNLAEHILPFELVPRYPKTAASCCHAERRGECQLPQHAITNHGSKWTQPLCTYETFFV